MAISDKAPVPRFVTNTLRIVGGKGQFKAIAVGIIFEPLKSSSILKASLEICCWNLPVSNINRVTSMVFAVFGWGADFCPLTSWLVALFFNPKEERFLLGKRAECGNWLQDNAICPSVRLHFLKFFCCCQSQAQPPVGSNCPQLRCWGFLIGKVSQDIFDYFCCWGRAGCHWRLRRCGGDEAPEKYPQQSSYSEKSNTDDNWYCWEWLRCLAK